MLPSLCLFVVLITFCKPYLNSYVCTIRQNYNLLAIRCSLFCYILYITQHYTSQSTMHKVVNLRYRIYLVSIVYLKNIFAKFVVWVFYNERTIIKHYLLKCLYLSLNHIWIKQKAINSVHFFTCSKFSTGKPKLELSLLFFGI